MKSTSKHKRIASLDGLRGVAALCVAVFHFQELFSKRPFFGWGYLNVDLFFVISGFILSKIYLDNLKSGTVSGLGFVWRRIKRLWPLHAATLLLMLSIELIMWPSTGYHVLSEPDNRSTFALNLFLVHNIGFTGWLTWNKPSWSISVEMAVDLAWAAAVIGGVWSRRTALAVAVLGTGVLYHLRPNLNSELDMAFGFLNGGIVRCAVGFALGYLLNEFEFKAAHPNFSATVAMVALACVVLFFDLLPGVDYLCLWLLFPALVVLTLDERTWLSRVLGSRICAFLGEISYSIYLLHYPINIIVINLNLFVLSKWLGFGMLQAPLIGLVYLITLLACSYLSYRLIELPPMRRATVGKVRPVVVTNSPLITESIVPE